jgi:hypothetical protein
MTPLSPLLLAAVLAAPPGGKALVLDNGQVIEGQVDRVGDRYRVVKDGGETFLPATRVRAVCPDLAAAHQTLSGAVGATDADGRLRLARWCESVGLRAQAIAEAKAAGTLKPGRADIQRYLTHLQSATVVQTSATTTAAPPSVPELPPVQVGADVLRRFTTKVQPILMNACASCHVGEQSFRLQRVFADGLTHRGGTQFNLSAAVAQVDGAIPAASKLLKLAVSAHGGAAAPPLRDKDAPPYKALEEWVALVAVERRPPTPPRPAVAPVIDEPVKPVADAPKPVADPFDPATFNRQHHSGGSPLPDRPNG